MSIDSTLLDIHPVVTRNYNACSLQIINAATLIYNWVDMSIPGAIIYGKARMGKSRLIDFVIENFEKDFKKNIPIYKIEWTTHTPKENTFFEILLDAFNHDIPFEGRPIEKRKRLRNHLVSIVSESKQNKLILFIDEANLMKKIHYDWLLDVYNDLERNGIILVTFLVGQEQILNTFNELKNMKAMQIIGRFMSDAYRFTGLTSTKEFEFILNEFDQNLFFPADSGISYTQFFFSEQYKEGFRLVNYLENIVDAFKYLQAKYNISVYKEVPGMYIVRCIEDVLKSYGQYGENLKTLTIQHWINAIERTGYVTASLSIDNEKILDNSYLNNQIDY